jgi:hypothetical protein
MRIKNDDFQKQLAQRLRQNIKRRIQRDITCTDILEDNDDSSKS